MNEINYYYLDGIEKKGPFVISEMLTLNLLPTTLIYFDGLINWSPLSQVEDLKQPEFSEEEQQKSKNNIESLGVIQKLESKPKMIKIPSFVLLIITISLTTFLSFFYTKYKAEKDLKSLETKIDAVLQGKDEICDYKNDAVKGKLNVWEFFTPSDNEGNGLIEYYKCENGGWKVLALKRLNNGFEYIESISTNMGFKVPERNFTPSVTLSNEYSMLGNSYPTNRGTVQNAYNQSMYIISSKKENKSYVAGSYLKIKTFEEISTDFYSISNIEPTIFTNGSVNEKTWKSSNDGFIFDSKWIVWYKNVGKHLEIVENQNQFKKCWLTYSIITGIITSIIFFLLKYRNRIELQMK